jgi:hypothetical protein
VPLGQSVVDAKRLVGSFVRFRVDGTSLCKPAGLLRRQLDLDPLRDLAGDLTLQRQHVTDVLLVAVRPQGLVGRGVDQLDGDPDAVLRPQYRALHQRLDPELARDIGSPLARSFVVHCGRA